MKYSSFSSSVILLSFSSSSFLLIVSLFLCFCVSVFAFHLHFLTLHLHTFQSISIFPYSLLFAFIFSEFTSLYFSLFLGISQDCQVSLAFSFHTCVLIFAATLTFARAALCSDRVTVMVMMVLMTLLVTLCFDALMQVVRLLMPWLMLW